MGRDNRVRLSDGEKQDVQTARDQMYPDLGDEAPLGAVIGELAKLYIEGDIGTGVGGE